jgi:NTE family protein
MSGEIVKETSSNSSETIIEPVRYLPDEIPQPLEKGIALCLSGGGYRAMLFHAGALWRLNDFGYLTKLKRISSVSGGSITAGVLAMNWHRLGFKDGIAENFESEVIAPVKKLASHTIDVPAVIIGTLLLGRVGNRIAASYRKHLFGSKTLQDLPDEPRFVINATNIQSGALWRFSKPYMRDWRVGEIKNPKIDLATAVAASSAFPPVLSPVRLRFNSSDFTPDDKIDLTDEGYRRNVVLTDGGVYDNLGLETVWKKYETVLVSDAGAAFAGQAKPKRDWFRHTARVLFIIDNQVRNLRRRQLIESYKLKIRRGAYWSIGADLDADYKLKDALPCPVEKTAYLANVATRLQKLDATLQEKLINWGYAVTDAALRQYVDPTLPPPKSFPFNRVGIG